MYKKQNTFNMKPHSLCSSALMLGGLFCSTLSAHPLDCWDFVTIKSSRSDIDDPSKYTVGKLNSITGQRETLDTKIFGYNDGNAV